MATRVQYSPKHQVVIRASQDAAEVIGRRFGSFVRSTAQQSIRKPNKAGDPSPPGQPPRAQTKVLKASILFAYDPASRSVVIGPRLLPGRIGKDAPEALEKGGQSVTVIRGRRRRQRIAKRAFMVPALEKRLPELPLLWRNAIRG